MEDQHGDEAAGHPQVQGRVREGVEEVEGRHPGQDCETLGIGRSTARRLLAQAWERRGAGGAGAAVPVFDQSRQLLVRVWVLMDMPCGKYLKAMLPQWLPVLRDCGLDAYDGFTFSELMAMSASKSYLATPPAPRVWRLRVRPAKSITIRKASDELDVYGPTPSPTAAPASRASSAAP